MEKIDLHIHTNLSDGDHNINDIIHFSKQNNCYKIAITDHEIINDYNEISKNCGIDIINGIEFNTSQKGLHILGYGIKNFDIVQNKIDWLHKQNEIITFELVDNLKKRNYNITLEQIENHLKAKGIIYKYLDKRHVARYLIENGYTKDIPDTYQNLIGRGTELYTPLKKIDATEILELVSKGAGLSILAHPYTLGLDEYDFIKKVEELKYYGLDGIEIVNGRCAEDLKYYYNSVAEKYNLTKTIGSDFHSRTSQTIGLECEEIIYEKIKHKIKEKNR